jgi:hypothetical protein
MRNGFWVPTKLTGSTLSSQQIIFCSNSVMPNHPQLNLYFQRNLALPKMFKGSIHAIATQVIVHWFNRKFATFCPFRVRFVLHIS